MKSKKPDIFLGITMAMLVIAALLCLAIIIIQKTGKTFEPDDVSLAESVPVETNGSETAPDVAETTPAPVETTPALSYAPIDTEGLKKALDEELDGLTSEWQVVVTDPYNDAQIASAVNCGADDWMSSDSMVRLYILGAAYQKVADGVLTEDQIKEDAEAMIVSSSASAADRLTELIGDGDSQTGREAVKEFATSIGSKLGFNHSLSGEGAAKPNYVTAKQNAIILDMICRGECVNADASKKMLDLLLTPVEEPEIETGLEGDAVSGFVYDVKSGDCINAAGIVRIAGRCYVVSIVCNLPVTTEGAKGKITKIIALTQPYFTQE